MGRGIVETGLFRSEQYVLDERTSDPASYSEGEAWIRTDVAPDTNQIATLRFANGGGTIDIPIYDTAASSGSNVSEAWRVRVNGVTGFIPTIESGGTYDQLRLQHNGAWRGAHDSLTYIPNSALLQWQMSAGSGSTVTDSINNFDGSFAGGPTWVSDANAVDGYKIDLDGANDAIEADLSRTEDYVAGAVTIEPDSWNTSGFNYVVGGEYDSNGDGAVVVRQNSGSFEFFIKNSGGNNILASTSTLPSTGAKTRIGYRFDGSNVTLFYNGSVESETAESDTLLNWVFIALGYRKYDGTGSIVQDREFDGDVDNFITFATNTASELPDDQWFTNDYNNQPWS